MVLTGSIVNFLGILLGGGVGLLIHRLMKKGIPERFSDIIMKGIGLCVLAIAFDGILAGENPMITIFATVIGAVIGEWIDLDGKLHALSGKLEQKFARGSDSLFAKGFMTATLLFCVGTMAIKGSLDSGLLGNHDILIAKSVMDTVAALVFASSLGVGVLFSAVPTFLYQGTITLLATVAQPFLGADVIAEMNTIGSLLLFALSLDLLGVCRLKLMNYIPTMFMPILLCLFM